MAARKYWLQLPQTYFTRLSQRKMRKQPDGEIMQIIYLKMLLACIGNSGLIFYQGVYDSLAEEIAEEIDEETETVQKTIEYILKNNMAREIEDEIGEGYFFPESDELTGSESESAERMRRMREKLKSSQSDGNVTGCDGDVTGCDDNKVKNNKVNVKKSIIDSSLHFTKDEGTSAPSADAGATPSPFTFTDVKKCADENNINLTERQLHNFYAWMEKYNWTIKGGKVSKLENALAGYAKKHSFKRKTELPQPEQEQEEITETEEQEETNWSDPDSLICYLKKEYGEDWETKSGFSESEIRNELEKGM